MKITSNAVVIIVVTIVLLGGLFWYFSASSGVQAPLTAGATTNQAQVQFQTLVGELTPITFNTTIFSDPRFNALIDLSTPVMPEQSGRLDPFAPIAGIGQ